MKLQPLARWAILGVMCAFASIACMFSVCWGSEAEAQVVVEDDTPTWVSDDEASKIPPAKVEQVARELFQIQQAMGGSIVVASQSESLHPKPAQLFRADSKAPNASYSPQPAFLPATPYQGPLPTTPHGHKSPVVILREMAWQLDISAYHLETLDLFSQADDLREAAAKLRHDAREMKQKAED